MRYKYEENKFEKEKTTEYITQSVSYTHLLIGRGAFLKRRSCTGRSSGFLRRENAGMSSERKVGILPAEYLRFPA